MITVEQKDYGRDFYWRGKWIGTLSLSRCYILVVLARPHRVLALMFGLGRRNWYENFYYRGDYFQLLEPRSGIWKVQVDGKAFSYLQITPIIREIIKVARVSP